MDWVAWAGDLASKCILAILGAYLVIVQKRSADKSEAIQREADRKREQARAESAKEREAEAKWRADMEKKIADQEKAIRTVIRGQCGQMRSDIVHKYHRYVDDLGGASFEEKDAFQAEYVDYVQICELYGIENDLIDHMAEEVMALPNVRSRSASS